METTSGGRVAIVTGGSRGMGEAISVALAQKGANVVITDIISFENVVKKIEDVGRRALFVKTDVSSYDGMQRMSRKTLDDSKGLTRRSTTWG